MNVLRLRDHQAMSAVLLATLSLFASGTTSAATLLLHYDVNNPASWNGTTLADLNGFGATLTPTDGAERTDNIPPAVTAADFGAPVFTASGATTPVAPPMGYTVRNRAFLDFTKLGLIEGPSTNRDQSIFETPGAGDNGTNANVAGYTMEGYFLIRTGYLVAENTGIGFGQDTGGENQLIRLPRGTNGGLRSGSSLDNSQGGPQSLESIDQDINAAIPRDQWFHFVKVHDPVADQIRFYLNGALLAGLTQSLDPDSSAVEYHPVDVQLGNVGQPGREIRNIGYSMTRFYRGALTDAEIQANFLNVAFVPEPTSLGLLAVGAMAHIGFRRRQLDRG